MLRAAGRRRAPRPRHAPAQACIRQRVDAERARLAAGHVGARGREAEPEELTAIEHLAGHARCPAAAVPRAAPRRRGDAIA
jgi:hypothetical protein